MNTGLVSIVVPCYNIEKYIERCINSIINQTYKNLEIIAVNDGSKDNTLNILNRLKLKEPRLKVLNYENHGPSFARNRGIEQAQGQYIMFVDGDDFLNENIVNELLNTLEEKKLDIIACNYSMYYSQSEKVVGNKTDTTNLNESSIDFIKRLFEPEKRFCSAWAKLYKMSLLKNMCYPENIYFGEDMFTAHILFDKAKKVGYIDKELYYYSQEGVSLVRSKFNVNKINMVVAAKNWVELCQEKYPSILSQAYTNYYSTMINICSYLCMDKEFYSYYFTYKTELKNNKDKILKSCLSKNDKIKAVLIMLMPPNMYYKVRTILLKE